MKRNAKTILLSFSCMSPALLHAAELEQQLARCSALADAAVRLSCFDGLAKATADVAVPAASATVSAAAPSAAAPAIAAGKTTERGAETISHTVQSWELDPNAKRGVFALKSYLDNYVLLANYSSSTNLAPYNQDTPNGLNPQKVELTYQLSFKMKMAESIAGSPVDLWLAYTQQSFWQAYNRANSSPFRETNYQPELIATLPLKLSFGDFNLRYLNFGLVHQSNGQSSTLSRSWNRFYTELGAEYGNLALSARIWKRLDNATANNDNIDIVDYMGHGDVRATYRQDGYQYSLLARRNFQTGHGAVQASMAFPVTTNLKGYVQMFSGYGESLIDYNYAQKSIGAGFLIDF
ncbi:phospholipase A [Collimonas pratensis]|uniref:Phospholipase A1 n=1 Tax=Collimonas pratensis TaxID=279113 RepID=A0A127Q1L2_9BURK|nr:phospholipase A [Collimonas pratensis]AMP03914.1 phospholipase A1 family protein [Collimonas pratensis]